MKLKRILFLLIIISCISFGSFAQNDNSATHDIKVVIPEVALLGVVSETQTDISLHANLSTEAGNAVDFSNASNNRVWINYSSIISEATPKRKVIAMVQGDMPQGVKLIVEASEFAGSGKGKLGKPAGEVTLTNQPSDVIVDIGSCYTGKGVNNGHFLTYKLEKNESSDSYAALNRQNSSVNVVYTLTDYN
jgi:hypothetical protein